MIKQKITLGCLFLEFFIKNEIERNIFMNEKKFKERHSVVRWKRLFSMALVLAMVISLLPMNSLKVYAMPTFYYNGSQWRNQETYGGINEGDELGGFNYFESNGGEAYSDKILMVDGDHLGAGAKVVKIDGNKIYFCSNHDPAAGTIKTGYCDTCGRNSSGEEPPAGPLVESFDIVVPTGVTPLTDEEKAKTVTEITSTYLSTNSNTLAEGWYVVDGDVSESTSDVSVTGNVNIILKSGTLSLKSMNGGTTNDITFWTTEGGSGKISVSTGSCSALCSNNLIINGGTISAVIGTTDTQKLCAIKAQNNIAINGGTVTAESQSRCGCGIWASNGNITINGGTVNATDAGDKFASSLPYTGGISAGNNFTINGGEIIANSDKCSGIFAYGAVTIAGGSVTAISNALDGISGISGITIANTPTRVKAGESSSTSSLVTSDYANNISSKKYVYISYVPATEITGTIAVTDIDAPVKGTALDTVGTCSTTGISTTSPAVTWKVGETEQTGTAKGSTIYTAYVTLDADSTHGFAAVPSVTINGQTAAVNRIDDTRIIASYTFAETAVDNCNDAGHNHTYVISGDGDDRTITITANGDNKVINSGCRFSTAGSSGIIKTDSSIKKIIISPGITTIGDTAFYGCNHITSVTLPSSVTAISKNALKGCMFESITLPENLSTIGMGAFYGCSQLRNIEIPNSVTAIGSASFLGCSNLENITIGNGVNTIEPWTFSECSALESITIPSNVTTIGGAAFDSCSQLNSITFEGTTTIEPKDEDEDYYTFGNLAATGIVRVPMGKVNEYKTAITAAGITFDDDHWTIMETSSTAKTISYDLRGGAFTSAYALPDAHAEVGDKLTAPEFPEGVMLKKGDLSLQGWFKDAACSEEWNFENDVVTGDMTLYAGYAYDAGNEPVKAEMSVSAVEDVIYTGKAHTPVVTVKHGTTTLTLGKDYTVSYKNNVNANLRNADGTIITGGIDDKYNEKLPTIIVKGKGNYKDTVTLNFNIKPRSVSLNNVMTADVTDCIFVKPKSVSTIKCVVKYNNKKLSDKKDYTAVLKKLDDAGNIVESSDYPSLKVPKGETGKYRLTVTGIGNYGESFTKDILLTDSTTVLNMSKASVKLDKITFEGTALSADEIKSKIKSVKIGNTELAAADYDVVLADDLEDGVIKDAGKYAITLQGKDADKIAGTKLVNINIGGIKISKAKAVFSDAPTYNGKSFGSNGMKLIVKDDSGEKELVLGTDYTIKKISNANKAGTATVEVEGKGIYTGSKKYSYKINKKNVADTDLVIAPVDAQKYQKSGAMPDVEISFSGNKLIKGTDYTLSYKDNMKLGSGSITVKGKGNFSGTKTDIPFTIEAGSFVESNVTVEPADVVYNEKKPIKYQAKVAVLDSNKKKLSAGKDYSKDIKFYEYTGEFDGSLSSNGILAHKGATLSENATPTAGTRIVVEISNTSTGVYTGTVYGTYRIVPAGISGAKFKVKAQMYTGSSIKISGNDITQAVMKKTNLVYGRDYEIVEGSYSKNIKVGTASVKLHGIGNYGGTKVVRFKITKKDMEWWKKIASMLKR